MVIFSFLLEIVEIIIYIKKITRLVKRHLQDLKFHLLQSNHMSKCILLKHYAFNLQKISWRLSKNSYGSTSDWFKSLRSLHYRNNWPDYSQTCPVTCVTANTGLTAHIQRLIWASLPSVNGECLGPELSLERTVVVLLRLHIYTG